MFDCSYPDLCTNVCRRAGDFVKVFIDYDGGPDLLSLHGDKTVVGHIQNAVLGTLPEHCKSDCWLMAIAIGVGSDKPGQVRVMVRG